MNFKIEISEQDVRKALLRYINETSPVEVKLYEIKIEVRSSQNFKSEWEKAAFRGVAEGTRS